MGQSSFIAFIFPKGSLTPLLQRVPLHSGQVGLWFFHASMQMTWKYFLQVEQSYNFSFSLSISVKHIVQSVSSFRSISLLSFPFSFIRD